MSKLVLALCAFAIAALQAWDSHALQAEPAVRIMVLVGVLLPAVAIGATRDFRVRGVAVLAAAVLMVTARLLSAQHMPELALAALFPGMVILLDHFRGLATRKETTLANRPRKE